MRKIRALLIIFLFLWIASRAGDNLPTKVQKGFIENKGQIHDQNFKANLEVKYLLNLPGMNVQLKSNGFSYDTYICEKNEIPSSKKSVLYGREENIQFESTYKYHRIDIEFVNANSNPQIITEERSLNYLNFYNSVTPESGATEVYHFGKIIYKNIYPNIDVEFVAGQNGKTPIEYNFILKPGAEINNIKLKYKGAFSTELKTGMLNLKVAQGTLTEQIPISYWQNSGKKEKINYYLVGTNKEETIIGYSGFDKPITQTLIIDPTPNLEWGTYFGNGFNVIDFALSISTDKLKNLYVVGGTGASNQIATSGSYQSTIGGQDDGYIAKFNKTGALLWATYYGGANIDRTVKGVLDSIGNLYVTGYTQSPSIMATSGTHQTMLMGNQDGFIAKFNPSGTRIWGTYFGDVETVLDACNSICIDKFANLYVVGETTCSNGIATSGTYNNVYRGSGDAYLAKFDNNGQRMWGTYFGGDAADYGYGLTCDKSGNVTCFGKTSSNDSIATTGAFQTTPSVTGSFLTKFNNTGNRVWGTYYNGGGEINVKDICSDNNGNLYMTGSTYATVNISFNSVGQQFWGGQYDGFVCKFSPSGMPVWGEYIGGPKDDYGISLAMDSLKNIYIGGYSDSFTGIATPGAYRSNKYNNQFQDGFINKFDSTGVKIFGTYYGGNRLDDVRSICVNGDNEINVCGNTNSNDSVATTGAFMTTYTGTQIYDEIAFVAKFSNNGAIGIMELSGEENNGLLIYPNPNCGEFTIKAKEEITLTIVNELGQKQKTILLTSSNNYSIQVENLKSGIYFITGNNEKISVGRKVIVQD